LAPTPFRFPALASLAGRAPLGGDREVALATYLAARLAHDALATADSPSPFAPSARSARRVGWRLFRFRRRFERHSRGSSKPREATRANRAALRAVIAAATSRLDPASRLELNRLVETFDRAPSS
jgi:hypothetical protein